MSQIYNKPEYKVPITTQEKLNATIAGGTVEEGLPYAIVGKCPEIYGNGQIQSVAPTTSTVGEVGDLYIALINNVVREWECVSVNGTTYLWREKLREASLNGASLVYNGEIIVPMADGSTDGAMSNSDYTKLGGIETGADVTDATNVENAGAIMKTAQTLTTEEKTQARTNIGAATSEIVADWDNLRTL